MVAEPWATSAAGRAGLVDDVAAIIVERLFMRPAAGQNALKVRPDDPLVALFEAGMELEDRFSGAADQAPRFAMRHGHIAADEIERELDDHSDAA